MSNYPSIIFNKEPSEITCSFKIIFLAEGPGRVAQSVGHLTRKSGVWQHTFVSPSAFSRRAVVSYWRKYVHEVLVNRLGGLSLPRKSVVRLTDRPDMTLDVYRGRKTTMQQNLAEVLSRRHSVNKVMQSVCKNEYVLHF